MLVEPKLLARPVERQKGITPAYFARAAANPETAPLDPIPLDKAEEMHGVSLWEQKTGFFPTGH
jgi:hypothetical protein